MSAALVLLGALALDAVIGEPRALWSRLPHPAVLMGRAVALAEARLNRGARRLAKGALAVAGLVLAGGTVGAVLARIGWPVELATAAVLLAQRSLVDHVRAVALGLAGSVEDGRAAVAMIVGRDTEGMDAPRIARAAIESAAENFSDGVVAPAFWFLVAGLPGMVAYKVINTADSMIGYRTERYERFGKAAARLDDLVNWLPARLTAVIFALTGGGLGAWRAIVADARRHRSPNAGWPEAALARGLGVAVSGPRSYHGALRDEPFVNAAGRRTIGADEIEAAVRALWRAWAVLLCCVALFCCVALLCSWAR